MRGQGAASLNRFDQCPHCMLCSIVLFDLLQLEQRLQAKEAENQELMGMCDQLLQQQEAQR